MKEPLRIHPVPALMGIYTGLVGATTTINHLFSSYFYLYTVRFRHEYRLERRMMSYLDVDDPEINVLGDGAECGSTGGSARLREILCPLTFDEQQLKASSLFQSSSNLRREISRVVVLHNDKVASFSNACVTDNYDVPEDFFDTPEFWSGSITWW